MSDMPPIIPTKQVTDFSVGYKNVESSAKNAIYRFEDGKDVIENVLRTDLVPRYTYPNGAINLCTSLGDILCAITHLSSRIDKLETDMKNVKDSINKINKHVKEESEEVEDVVYHVVALENNLRSLRDTLTYGELEEEDLPILDIAKPLSKTVKE